jgi:hypothetical protein
MVEDAAATGVDEAEEESLANAEPGAPMLSYERDCEEEEAAVTGVDAAEVGRIDAKEMGVLLAAAC